MGLFECLLVFGLNDKALEAWFRPGVFILVLFVPVAEALFVLRCLVPYLLFAYFVEQEAVVVFLYEIAQFGVVQMGVEDAVHHHFSGEAAARVLHEFLDAVFGRGIFNALTLQARHDIGVEAVKGFELLALHHSDDMITHGRFHGSAVFAHLEGVGSLLEGFEGHAGTHPGEFTTAHSTLFVLRIGLG